MTPKEQEEAAVKHAPNGGYPCFLFNKGQWNFTQLLQSKQEVEKWFDDQGKHTAARVYKVNKGKAVLFFSK